MATWYAYEVRGDGRHEYGAQLTASIWDELIHDVHAIREETGVTWLRLGKVRAASHADAIEQIRLGRFISGSVEIGLQPCEAPQV